MKQKVEKQEKVESLFKATFGVIEAALNGNVDESYEHQFPDRKILHEISPPHVQAVNQHLDERGIDLEKQHIPLFKKGDEITQFKPQSTEQNIAKCWKEIKNERQLATSFHEESVTEQQKGDSANQRKIVYAKAGHLAHTIFGSVKASGNPYVSTEDTLGTGTMLDYLEYSKQKQMK